MNISSWTLIYSLIVSFFIILLCLLYKYKKEEHNKSLFWKIPLISFIYGVIFILVYYISFLFQDFSEIMISLEILSISLKIGIIFALIGIIMSFNLWYKGNIFVAYVLIIIGFVLLNFIGPLANMHFITRVNVFSSFVYLSLFATSFILLFKVKSSIIGSLIGGGIGIIVSIFFSDQIMGGKSSLSQTVFAASIFWIFPLILSGALIGWLVGKMRNKE